MTGQKEKPRDRSTGIDTNGDGGEKKCREKRRSKLSAKMERSRRKEEIKAAPEAVAVEEEDQVLCTIVTTDTAHARMRKVSKLGLEDPVDTMLRKLNEEKQQSAAQEKKKDRTSARPRTSRTTRPTRPKVNPDEVDNDNNNNKNPNNDSRQQLRRATMTSKPQYRKEPSRDRMRRTKSNDSGFKPPSMLNGMESIVEPPERKQRSKSLDDDKLLLDMRLEFPPTKDMKLRSQSLDDDKIILEQSEFPPVHLNVPQNEVELPKDMVALIDPTRQQKQLMRKISALGLEDPVFGNVHEQLKPRHASNIFEDMDFADVPEDMRDMLSLASDHTDEVLAAGLGQLESPIPRSIDTKETEKTAALTGSSRSSKDPIDSGSTPDLQPDRRLTFAPPEGSFIRRESNRTLGQEVPCEVPPAPAVRDARMRRNSNDRSRSTKASSDGSSTPSPNAFIPPSGSFAVRKPRASRPPRHAIQPETARDKEDTLMREIELYEQAETLYPDMMGGSKSNLGASFSNLNQSSSSLNDSWNAESRPTKPKSSCPAIASRPPRSKANRRASNPQELYVPPPAPSGIVSESPRESTRRMPSVAAIFSPSVGPARKTIGDAKPPPVDRTKLFAKTPSSRSWDGDLDIDPLDGPTASMSNFDNIRQSGVGNTTTESKAEEKQKSRKQKTTRQRWFSSTFVAI